jgi:hypothetical protein
VAANDEGKIQFCDSNLALSVRHRQLAEFEGIPLRGVFKPKLKRFRTCDNE